MRLKVFLPFILQLLSITFVLGQFKQDDYSETHYDQDTVLAQENGEVELNIRCIPSLTEVSCQKACKGDLIFEDNFDWMDWTKWQKEIYIGMSTGDGEFVSYQNRTENLYINDGELNIMPSFLYEVPGHNTDSITSGTLNLRSECTALLNRECYQKAKPLRSYLPPIVSARIRTKGSFEFRYGRVDVRAKLPKGDWLYPQILLEPVEHWYGYDRHASGQMRVAFARGNENLFCDQKVNDGRYIEAGVILSGKNELAARKLWTLAFQLINHVGSEYHVYSLIWTDKYIDLEIDGVHYGRIHGGFNVLANNRSSAKRWERGEFMAPLDRKFYLVLGLGVGGNSDFSDNCVNNSTFSGKPWMNSGNRSAMNFWNARNEWMPTWRGEDAGLHVDYVRVYAI